MVIDMDDEQLRTLVDVQGFLDGTVAMEFAVASEDAHFADGEHLFRSNVNGCRGGVAR